MHVRYKLICLMDSFNYLLDFDNRYNPSTYLWIPNVGNTNKIIKFIYTNIRICSYFNTQCRVKIKKNLYNLFYKNQVQKYNYV
jgi:hypothetical protein